MDGPIAQKSQVVFLTHELAETRNFNPCTGIALGYHHNKLRVLTWCIKEHVKTIYSWDGAVALKFD